MKYILLLSLLLSGCSFEDRELGQIDKDLKEIRQSTKRIDKQLRIIDCNIGLLSAFKHFNKQLYKKVTKEQFEAAWKECENIGLEP